MPLNFDTSQVKSKPRTPPPVDEAAERERAALGDKISQLQERMRQRKEELAKQKESETQAAAAGPSLSDLEKQKMEKMRQFIAQARDAKGVAPGQSVLSSLPRPGMLSPLGGVAEGLSSCMHSFRLVLEASVFINLAILCMNCPSCLLLCRWWEKVAGTSCGRSSPAILAPPPIDCVSSSFLSKTCKTASFYFADAAASVSARSARILSARFI